MSMEKRFLEAHGIKVTETEKFETPKIKRIEEAKYNVTLKNGAVMSVMASSPKEAIEKANSGKGKQVGSYTSKQKADKAELDEAAGYVHRNINYSLENLGGRYWALVIVNKENKEKFERHPLDSKMLGAVLDSVGAVDFDNWEGAKVSLGKLQFKQLGVVNAPEPKTEDPAIPEKKTVKESQDDLPAAKKGDMVLSLHVPGIMGRGGVVGKVTNIKEERGVEYVEIDAILNFSPADLKNGMAPFSLTDAKMRAPQNGTEGSISGKMNGIYVLKK